MRSRLALSTVLVLLWFYSVNIATAQTSRKVTARNVDSIVQAIQDEVYAY